MTDVEYAIVGGCLFVLYLCWWMGREA